MRIRELFENKYFNPVQYVSEVGDNKDNEINYDLVEDLFYFINNDDDIYRKKLYPIIAFFLEKRKVNKVPPAKIFARMVEESYDEYKKQFPIKELPKDLSQEMNTKICEKLYDMVVNHDSNDSNLE